MHAYILKRILFFVPLFFVVSFFAFLLINASAKEPAVIVLEAQGVPAITEDLIEETNIKYGFDRPFISRYADWLNKALRFEFGKSFVTNKDVSKDISTAFLYTLQLSLMTAVITITISLFLGVLCALWEGRRLDRLMRIVMFVLLATPSYLVGSILAWVFGVKMRWLPTSGAESLKSLVLPTIVMSIGYCGFYFRLILNAMLENVNEEYVNFYRSSGVSEKRITMHILRNSLQTAIVVFSMAIPGMLVGTVVIENIFAWPGIGRLCLNAVLSRDIPVIQAYVLLIAVFYCSFNILADIINVVVNPRLRKE